MSLIKVAYFMLNFLNLKSKARHLFFWVASSLSMVCDKGFKRLQLLLIVKPDKRPFPGLILIDRYLDIGQAN